MTAEVYTTQNQRKFIPLLCCGTWNTASPSWLKGKYYIDLRGSPHSQAKYQDLLTTLHDARPAAPPVGPRPLFEPTSPVPPVDPAGNTPISPVPVWRVTLSAKLDCASPDDIFQIVDVLRTLCGDVDLSLVQVRDRRGPSPLEIDIATSKSAGLQLQRSASAGTLREKGVVSVSRPSRPIKASNTALLYLLSKCCFPIEDKLAFLRNARDMELIYTRLVPFALNVFSDDDPRFLEDAANVLEYITLIQMNYLFALREHGLATNTDLQAAQDDLCEEPSPEMALHLHNQVCALDPDLAALSMADIERAQALSFKFVRAPTKKLVDVFELMRHWQGRLTEIAEFFAARGQKSVLNLFPLLEDYREFLYHLSASIDQVPQRSSGKSQPVAEAVMTFRRAALHAMMYIQSTLATNCTLERADVAAMLHLRRINFTSRYSETLISEYAILTDRMIVKYIAG